MVSSARRLGVATGLIQAVELLRQFAGAGRVPSEEEFDDVVRNVHAAGRVDAGRDAEADFGRCRCAIQRDFSELHQRAQAGLDRIRKCSKPQCRDRAVLAGKRDRVGDRGNGDELQKRREQYATGALAERGSDQA